MHANNTECVVLAVKADFYKANTDRNMEECCSHRLGLDGDKHTNCNHDDFLLCSKQDKVANVNKIDVTLLMLRGLLTKSIPLAGNNVN